MSEARAARNARVEYEIASTNRFVFAERMVALDTARRSWRWEVARRQCEVATQVEKAAAQRLRDCELLLAQLRYATERPTEFVKEPLRNSIRVLVDQTLDAHVALQRHCHRPMPLSQMWLDAVHQVQCWFPDESRILVSASLEWNPLQRGDVADRRHLVAWERATREFMREWSAERKALLVAEMETLERKMEALEINEGEYLKGMNQLKARYTGL